MPTYNGTELEDLPPEKLSEAYAKCCDVAWQAAEGLNMEVCNKHLVFMQHILGVLIERVANGPPEDATIN